MIGPPPRGVQRGVSVTLVCGAVLLGLCAPPTASFASDGEPQRRSGPEWDVLPEGLLYEPYLADLHRPTFRLAFASVQDRSIDQASEARIFVSLGARAGLLRWTRGPGSKLAAQLDLYAGFHGQFDRDYSNDNIGWDGIYGLMGSLRVDEEIALRIGLAHTSSHVGDEYAERTGRERINYTREELLVGGSWRFAPRWRAYGELASAYDLRNEALQEEGRWQLGLEYERPQGLWGTRIGWYAALDAEGMEERDWEAELSAQVGLKLPSESRDWRLGVACYDGRVPIGEFFQHEERYLAFGLWLDI
jgi:hypothetical protein